MVALQPTLKFQEIGVDTNKKAKQRKLEDQQRWQYYFHETAVEYFKNHNFQSFHEEFDPKRDQLDAFVPAYGSFICGKRNLGKRKGKNKKVDNSMPQSGCGRRWNSYLTMTKFVCQVKKNQLVVILRQYGQRCGRCSKEKNPYENPSFKDELVNEIIKFLLVSILDGIFNYIDPNVYVDYDLLEGPRQFRRVRFIKKQINDCKQTSDDNTETYVKDNGEVYTMEQIRHSVSQKHEGRNCEACDKNKGCGKRRKRRKRKKAKKAEDLREVEELKHIEVCQQTKKKEPLKRD